MENRCDWAVLRRTSVRARHGSLCLSRLTQARRTGTSTALGFLFDHGCDALNAGLIAPFIMAMALQAGSAAAGGTAAVVGIWACVTTPFFVATWEE